MKTHIFVFAVVTPRFFVVQDERTKTISKPRHEFT